MENWNYARHLGEGPEPEVVVEQPHTGLSNMYVKVEHWRSTIDSVEPPATAITARRTNPVPSRTESEPSTPTETYRDYFVAETQSLLRNDRITGRMKLEMEVGIELHPGVIDPGILTAEVASFNLAVSLQDPRFADRDGISDMRVHFTPQSFRQLFQSVFPNQVDGSATWHIISNTLKSAHDLGVTPFEYLETMAVENERAAWANLIFVLADVLAARYKEVILEQTRGNRHPITIFPYQVFRDKFGFALLEMFGRFSEFDSYREVTSREAPQQFEERGPDTGVEYDERTGSVRWGTSDTVLHQLPRPETRHIDGYLLMAANLIEERNRGLILNGLQVSVMLDSLRRGLNLNSTDNAYAVSRGVWSWIGAFYERFYGLSRIGQGEATGRRINEADPLLRQGLGIIAENLVQRNPDYRRFTAWELACDAIRALAETGDYLWCNDTSGGRSRIGPRSTIDSYFRPWYVARPDDAIVGVLKGFSEFDIDFFIDVTGMTRNEILTSLTRMSRGDDPMPTFDLLLLAPGSIDQGEGENESDESR